MLSTVWWGRCIVGVLEHNRSASTTPMSHPHSDAPSTVRKSRPLVSVILPTYNRVRFVGEAIESALRQSYRDLEVICIDDGSKDDTPAVVADIAERDPRVRYIRQANGGVSAARNHGLRLARGEWIAFLDSDDMWQPWKLEIQMELLAARPEVGMTWTNMDSMWADKRPHQKSYLKQMYSTYRQLPDGAPFESFTPLGQIVPGAAAEWSGASVGIRRIYSQMLHGNLVHTPTVVLKREWAEKVGPFDTGMLRGGEDFKYHLATCRLGEVAFIDVPSILYRIGIGNHITNRENNLHFARSFLRTLTEEFAGHRSEIELAPGEIRGILARAHDWLADELYADGQRRESFGHGLQAIAHRRTPGRTWRTLVKCLLPESVQRLLRRPQPLPASRASSAPACRPAEKVEA